jgi:D-amino-acid dehydrogenase
MLHTSKNIIILGGGIVGLSCALHAQIRGHRVTVIDPGGFGNGASFGNAGVVAVSECSPLAAPGTLRQVPGMLFSDRSPLTVRWSYLFSLTPWMLRFVLASRPTSVARAIAGLSSILARAKAAHHELAHKAGIENMLADTGWLKVFETDSSYQSSAPEFERMRSQGVNCDYIDRAGIEQLEPNLAPIFRHGIMHKDCEQISDPHAYTEALGTEFLKRGGKFVRAEVLALVRQNGIVTSARTGTGEYAADCFVIACGAWSKKLCGDVGTYVPLDTERGYHMILAANEKRPLGRPVYWGERAIVMSPSPFRLRVTSSVEFAGIKGQPDFRKLKRLIPEIGRGLKQAPQDVLAEWLGFRPSMPDSLPVICQAPKAENCYLAFGHGHLGLTLGPITGEIIADLIDGKAQKLDISPFCASRFKTLLAFSGLSKN